MIYTDNYYRWKRVEEVNQTPTGILAELHGEQLSIDVVRADVLRIKISRGGVFDESPTFAVCVDPLATPAHFRVEQDDERVQLITSACTASLWLDPFRLDVHRTDGQRWSRPRRTPRAATGPTPRSTTRSRSGVAAARRTRSSAWGRRPAATTARAATSPCGTPTC